MVAGRSIRVVRFTLFSCLTASFAYTASAQTTTRSQNDPRPVAQAALRQGEVTIDGRINEAAWAAATPITELVQSTPDEGKPPSQRTEVRILYDASAIYIGARMYDSLGARGIRSALARRDQVMNGDNNLTSDRIAFVFDPFRDKNNPYRFARLDRRVPHPLLAASLFSRCQTALGNADLAHDRSSQRIRHVGFLEEQ